MTRSNRTAPAPALTLTATFVKETPNNMCYELQAPALGKVYLPKTLAIFANGAKPASITLPVNV